MAKRIPESIAAGEPTRRELGAFLEAGPEIRTQPASDAYRENFDRIFGPKGLKDCPGCDWPDDECECRP